jgi:ATP-dependent helicase HrpB
MPVWELAARELPKLLQEIPAGDVLIFMPGAYEIRRTIEAVRRLPAAKGCEVLPLYGELSPAEQDRAVGMLDRRKIIVSTNVAETSLTIDGISIVIDSGLVRQSGFDMRRGINTLLIEKNSKDSATQRAGRAGRTVAGVCLRLWSEREHKKRAEHTLPELLRVDLSSTLLQLNLLLDDRNSGIGGVAEFPWITPPPKGAVDRAVALLHSLGAFDSAGEITDIGRRMAAFPLHPRMSRMLVAAEYYGCVPTMCLAAALLQERSILLKHGGRQVREKQLDFMAGREDSDVLLLIRLWEEAERVGFRADACEAVGVHGGAARAVGALRRQLERTAELQGLDCFEVKPDVDSIYKCLLLGFSDHVAIRVGGDRCTLVGGRRGSLAADTVLSREDKLLVTTEISEIGKSRGDVEVRLSGVTAIRREWLEEFFGEDFGDRRRVYYDTVGKRMLAEKQICFRDLVIESSRAGDVTDDEAAVALAAEIAAGRITLKKWDAKVEQWIRRVNLVVESCPELGLSAIGDDDRIGILEQVCLGARSAKDVKLREVWPALRQWLSYEQSEAVKAYAPEQVCIENGRRPRVHYDDPSGPYIAMQLQQLYDTDSMPLICNGRVKLKVRILAPNQRPVQITDDLASFWQNGYERVKKDLRGRYPKHEWR